MMSTPDKNSNEKDFVKVKSAPKATNSNKLGLKSQNGDILVSQKLVDQGHELGDWFVFRETRHFGPLTTKQVNQFLLARLISNEHHIWRPGLDRWAKINTVESFRSFGHSEIDWISDNDFSFQAQLGPIDRIKFQETEVSFLENQGARILNITVQGVQEGIAKKTSDLNEALNTFVKLLCERLGFTEKAFKPLKTAVLSAFALIFVFIGLGRLIFGGEETFLNKMPAEIKTKLVSNSKLDENIKSPSFLLFEKDPSLKDPVFVGSANLPLGSKVKIKIKADPKTLIGSYRFSKEIEYTLTSKIFQTEPIRGVSGQYLSPGKYIVKVTCLTCEKSNLLLTNYSFSYGIKNISDYKKELNSFHQKTRESASLELDELKDLSETLLEQYQNTAGVYRRTLGDKSESGWNKFSTSWLSNQKKIVDLFEQIQSEEFSSKLYYLGLYKSYGQLTKMLFELHVLQDKYILGASTNDSLAEQISELSQTVKLKLSYLKSQTELMRINYNRTSGLPPKEGLNLKKF